MCKILFPDETAGSAFEIDYEDLYRRGYRGIIFDIDNTLTLHDAPADDRCLELFARLKKIGFECALVSNNDRERVEMFNKDIGAHMVVKAGKPLKKGYLKAMELMGTEPSSTLAVGDQIFTDVWGAKRCGIFCIFTKRIDPREEIQIVLKRIPEKLVMFFYGIYKKRNGLKGGK